MIKCVLLDAQVQENHCKYLCTYNLSNFKEKRKMLMNLILILNYHSN